MVHLSSMLQLVGVETRWFIFDVFNVRSSRRHSKYTMMLAVSDALLQTPLPLTSLHL